MEDGPHSSTDKTKLNNLLGGILLLSYQKIKNPS